VSIVLIVLMPYRKFVVSVSTWILTVFFLAIFSINQWTYIRVRSQLCGDSRCENINSLWSLFCVGFINLIGVAAGVVTRYRPDLSSENSARRDNTATFRQKIISSHKFQSELDTTTY
jgi:hypothetical protein